MAKNTQVIGNLFKESSTRYPHNIAVSFQEQTLTYSQLNRLSNQFAHHLKKHGMSKGDFLPICADKSLNMIVAILGCIKLGVAFVPIHLDAPSALINTILQQIKASHICIHSQFNIKLEKAKAIYLDSLQDILSEYSDDYIELEVDSEAPAYVIYTSGTTGAPKGVLVSHNSVFHTYVSWAMAYELTHTDKHLQMAAPAFDVFVGDLVRALCSGAELVLCPKETLLSSKKLFDLIQDKNITCAEFTPAILRGLVKYMEETHQHLNSLRLLVCGSDLWTVSEYAHVKTLLSSHTRLINSYGLTEATIDSTYFEATLLEIAHCDPNELVPIGKAFPHVTLTLLNDDFQEVKQGETGEIYIGGQGVALGYLGQKALTDEKFIIHPHTLARLYKTGDMGKMLADGNIHFLGRNQNYVKINAQRVELLALDAVLNQHPKVDACITYTFLNNLGQNALGCFLLLKEKTILLEELVSFIKKHLPNYYIPQKIYEIESISLNANGKIERAADKQKIIREISPHLELPSHPLHHAILDSWKDMLGASQIGIHNDFFDLGGTSLMFASLLSQLNESFDVNIHLCEAKPSTVQGLAKLISEKKDEDIVVA